MKVFQSHILLIMAFVTITGCSSTKVKENTVVGSIVYQEQFALPKDATILVELTDLTPEDSSKRKVAHQLLEHTGEVPFLFRVEFEESAINPKHQYGIQARILLDEKVLFLNDKPIRVITQGKPNTIEVMVKATDNLIQTSTSALSIIDQSVLSDLAKRGHSENPEYEETIQRRASDFVPPKLLTGPHHKVKELVITYGPINHYWIESDFETFSAQGDAMLRRRVKEINALAKLTEMTRTKAYGKAVEGGFTGPFSTLYHLVVHPVDTITGVPKGLWAVYKSSEENIGATSSVYEDSFFEATVTLSKYKRQYAKELEIDVYTSNLRVQEELNRLSWAAVVGNWTPTFATAPVSLTIAPAVTSLDWIDSLNDVITEKPPGMLRVHNNDILTEIGIPEDLRNNFLNHPIYSPRHTTIIVRCLKSMGSTKGREKILKLALNARSEIEAFTCQQTVELLAGYHRKRSPIQEIFIQGVLPLGRSKENILVLCLPIDYGRWTPFSESLFRRLATKSKDIGTKKTEFWITGVLTARSHKELESLGYEITENVGKIIKMME